MDVKGYIKNDRPDLHMKSSICNNDVMHFLIFGFSEPKFMSDHLAAANFLLIIEVN